MKTYFKAAMLALVVACIGVTFASRDGSGTYTLPAGNPVNTGTAISSTWANNTLSDIATALTASIAKDGQTVPTANLPMGAFRHTNVGSATARNNYASASQVQDSSLQTLSGVAGTNTITGSLTPAITAYAAGMQINFSPANTNTSAATLAVNGLTALDVLKFGGIALEAGDLTAGTPAFLVLDSGADDWVLVNLPPDGADEDTTTTQLAMTPGCASAPTWDVRLTRQGNIVTIFMTEFSAGCISNSTSAGFTGIPAAYRPVESGAGAATTFAGICRAVNNGSQQDAYWMVDSDGDGDVFLISGSPWTASGTKSLVAIGCTISYPLNPT